MELKQLGNTEIHIKPLGLGTNVFGWTIDQPQSFRVLDAYTDAGLSLVDTADSYSRWKPGNVGGESEIIIGNWLHQSGKRDSIVLATKVGSEMGDGKKGLSKQYIIKAVEDSLRRLQTDYIDLYQSHFDDEVTLVAETMEAYSQLFMQGKIRFAGTFNMSPERIRESLEVSKANNLCSYATLQPLYSLCERSLYEQKYEALCQEYNLGVICYFPLASGFLTGKYRCDADQAKSVRGGGVAKYMNARGWGILKVLDEAAQKYNVPVAAIALAWLIARPSVCAPIASVTSEAQLAELVKAIGIKLDTETIAKLNKASGDEAPM